MECHQWVTTRNIMNLWTIIVDELLYTFLIQHFLVEVVQQTLKKTNHLRLKFKN